MSMTGEEQSGGVLDESIDSMCEKFKFEYPHNKISRTIFFFMHPSKILTSKQRHPMLMRVLRECLIVITKSCQKQNLQVLTSEVELKNTLGHSASDEAIHSDFVGRACERCGVPRLHDHFADVVEASRDQEITYYQWQYQRMVVDGKVSSHHNFKLTTTILV